MQISVEKTSELSRKMTVEVSEQIIQEKMEARFKTLARDVKLDGFRPGKVPPSVVKKMYAKRVKGEITGDLIQTTYYEALKEQNLKPAGSPHITASEEEGNFKYIAEFEVYPEISLDSLEQLEVVRSVAGIEDEDINKIIQQLREQKKKWKPVDRGAQEKDRIILHFSGVSEGENFTDGKVENFKFEMGSKQMMPGFEDELLDLEAGDSKTFPINFPEQYGNSKLAGKAAEFEIEVCSVEEPEIPELDADFMMTYGIEDGDLNSFREDVKKNMSLELDRAIKGKVKNSVMDALFEKIPVTLPKALIDQEIDNLMKPYQEQAKQQNIKFKDLNLTRETFAQKAGRRVALGLILAEIIQQNGITAESDKVRSTVGEMAKNYERPDDFVKWYYSDPKKLAEVEQLVLEEQTVDWVLEKIKVTEETASYSDLVPQDSKGGDL